MAGKKRQTTLSAAISDGGGANRGQTAFIGPSALSPRQRAVLPPFCLCASCAGLPFSSARQTPLSHTHRSGKILPPAGILPVIQRSPLHSAPKGGRFASCRAHRKQAAVSITLAAACFNSSSHKPEAGAPGKWHTVPRSFRPPDVCRPTECISIHPFAKSFGRSCCTDVSTPADPSPPGESQTSARRRSR